jgi:hypothetical protein
VKGRGEVGGAKGEGGLWMGLDFVVGGCEDGRGCLEVCGWDRYGGVVGVWLGLLMKVG